MILQEIITVKKCAVYHYWFFNHGFKFQGNVWSGCYDLSILCVYISDIAVITAKNVDYRCIIHDVNKSEATLLLENSVLDDHTYKKVNQRNRY